MAAAGVSAAPDASDSVLYIVRHGDRFDRETGGWDGKVGITFAATMPLAADAAASSTQSVFRMVVAPRGLLSFLALAG
eukprot:COSAG01_NODE_14619_length_1431_cov_1.204204_1_plen_77_part_10